MVPIISESSPLWMCYYITGGGGLTHLLQYQTSVKNGLGSLPKSLSDPQQTKGFNFLKITAHWPGETPALSTASTPTRKGLRVSYCNTRKTGQSQLRTEDWTDVKSQGIKCVELFANVTELIITNTQVKGIVKGQLRDWKIQSYLWEQ